CARGDYGNSLDFW
nr:immunoglobulin heavy chain junction region [Macaca mulatta]MOV59625.1 immunoglobulin heavy chain junction region [Macaca mulatta]MOX58700.1 immunoglobulin heavy chain junction region [Macaca mulatta]MOX59333.1 immunoglobulin heavy chain junction region [Macaca mulatta]MOX59780.1 immunoglobulin heavy chain junction region [Macaca mulatta]